MNDVMFHKTFSIRSRITTSLKLLKYREIIDKSFYESIKQVGSRPAILNVLVHIIVISKDLKTEISIIFLFC